MTEPSKSPERNTFQKEAYIKRKEQAGEEPSQDYLDMFERILEQENQKFDDPASRENNLEYELRTTEWILKKVRASDIYAQNLYAAMCNTEFQKLEVMPILKEDRWSCTWRYAGGIVADMQGKGDYIDWYCSGMGAWNEVTPDEFEKLDETAKQAYLKTKKYVGEGYVTDEIRQDLLKLGWKVIDDGEMV